MWECWPSGAPLSGLKCVFMHRAFVTLVCSTKGARESSGSLGHEWAHLKGVGSGEGPSRTLEINQWYARCFHRMILKSVSHKSFHDEGWLLVTLDLGPMGALWEVHKLPETQRWHFACLSVNIFLRGAPAFIRGLERLLGPWRLRITEVEELFMKTGDSGNDSDSGSFLCSSPTLIESLFHLSFTCQAVC